MKKSIVAAIVSASLIMAPAMAQAEAAGAPGASATPASERLEGQQALGNATWWIIGALLVGAIVLFVVLNDDDEDTPASP